MSGRWNRPQSEADADHLREDVNVMFRTSVGIEENMQKPSRTISVFSLTIRMETVT